MEFFFSQRHIASIFGVEGIAMGGASGLPLGPEHGGRSFIWEASELPDYTAWQLPLPCAYIDPKWIQKRT
jgi:hypothetical protein